MGTSWSFPLGLIALDALCIAEAGGRGNRRETSGSRHSRVCGILGIAAAGILADPPAGTGLKGNLALWIGWTFFDLVAIPPA